MNKIINYLKVIGVHFLILFIYILIISIFHYYELLSFKIVNLISYMFILLLHCYSGIKISRFERKKGYLNGFIIGLCIVLLFTIINLIVKDIDFSYLIYTLSLLVSSIIGGIIGVHNNN